VGLSSGQTRAPAIARGFSLRRFPGPTPIAPAKDQTARQKASGSAIDQAWRLAMSGSPWAICPTCRQKRAMLLAAMRSALGRHRGCRVGSFMAALRLLASLALCLLARG